MIMRMSEAIPKSIAPISAEDIKAAAITKTVCWIQELMKYRFQLILQILFFQ